jgi:hypothetical protein
VLVNPICKPERLGLTVPVSSENFIHSRHIGCKVVFVFGNLLLSLAQYSSISEGYISDLNPRLRRLIV